MTIEIGHVPTKRKRNAVDSLYGGELVGKRSQRVYTPISIVEALRALWPEGVACDPCSGPGSLVPAAFRVMPPQNGCKYVTEIPRLGDDGEQATEVNAKGKTVLAYIPAPPGLPFWPARTYVNPEFGDQLRDWIAQFLESWEVVMLAPIRPHRKWYRPLLRQPTSVCWLDPLTFVGFDQTFPAALGLFYRGDRQEQWRAATAKIGEVIP